MNLYDYKKLVRFLTDCEVETGDLEAMARHATGSFLHALECELQRRDELTVTKAYDDAPEDFLLDNVGTMVRRVT